MAVIDDSPREDFTPRHRHTLKEFAAIAMREMELWRDKVLSIVDISKTCLTTLDPTQSPGSYSTIGEFCKLCQVFSLIVFRWNNLVANASKLTWRSRPSQNQWSRITPGVHLLHLQVLLHIRPPHRRQQLPSSSQQVPALNRLSAPVLLSDLHYNRLRPVMLHLLLP